jgi:protein O-mannosyl-transferase
VAARPVVLAAILAAAVVAVFGQAAGFGFINFDDDHYVSNNPLVRNGLTAEGMAFAFSVENGYYWHPLTWLSLMVECTAGGPNAALHHIVNVALHAATVVLVFYFLLRATGSPVRAAIAAALFGLHPLRAESVAWIAERKDVLFAFFAALALLLYVRYAEQPSPGRYALACGAVVSSMLSKPAAVTLPVLLLIADYWPLRRRGSWRRLVIEKMPMAACALIVAVLTWIGQKSAGALALMDEIPAHVRVLKSAEWLSAYLLHSFWPAGLVVPYPYDPTVGVAAAFYWALAGGITAGAFLLRGSRPYLLAGWLWFVVALMPSLGLIQAGGQSIADRFTYLAHMGFFAALVWLAAERFSWKTGAAVAAVAAILCARQVALWRDSVTLFAHTVEHTPQNWVARLKLGSALADRGEYEQAAVQLREAVRQNPRSFHTHYNLGRALAALGNHFEATAEFSRSLELKPGYADAQYSLGATLFQMQRPGEAEAELRRAIASGVDPGYASEAHNLLGASIAQQGRMAEALAEFEAALRLDESNAGARRNAALAMQAIKQ